MEGVICKETGDRKGQGTGQWLGKTGGKKQNPDMVGRSNYGAQDGQPGMRNDAKEKTIVLCELGWGKQLMETLARYIHARG